MNNSGFTDPSEIIERLKPIEVNVEDLLLDPLNPRLSEFEETIENEEIIDSQEIQEKIFEKIKEVGDLEHLRDSIAKTGFLPISYIIVRRHFKKGSNKFVVIEGNRRIAAIKWLLRSKPAYLNSEIYQKRKKQLKQLQVLLLDTTPEKVENDRYIIQGVTHLNPARDWPAYAKARMCWLLYQQNLGFKEIATALGGGIRASEVGRLIRAYYAYERMLEDDEYSECAIQHKEFISYFSEFLNKKELRDWLGWDDEAKMFTNVENLKRIYELLCGENKKIRKQTDVRLLTKILRFKPEAIDQLIEESSYSIEDAYAEALAEEKRQKIVEQIGDWRAKIREAIETLEKRITPSLNVQELEDDIKLLTRLQRVLNERLKQLQAILGR